MNLYVVIDEFGILIGVADSIKTILLQPEVFHIQELDNFPVGGSITIKDTYDMVVTIYHTEVKVAN